MKSTSNRNGRPPIYTLRKAIRDFVRRRTNETEKLILKKLNNIQGDLNATNFVKDLHNKTGKSKTTLWYNLRKLRRNQILDFGNGEPLKLKQLGKLVLEKNKSKTDNNGDRKC